MGVGPVRAQRIAVLVATASASARRSPSPRRPSPSPSTTRASGRWELQAETSGGDLLFIVPGASTVGGGLYVSGSRAEPYLYRIGAGDPDSCLIVRYERIARS